MLLERVGYLKVIAGTCKNVWGVASKWKVASLISSQTVAKEIWRLEGSPALPRSMSWNYLKVSIFLFLLWLFCNQHLQRATQLFETQFTGAKRRVIKTNPNTRWFGDSGEAKDSHLYCEVKTTFITWKSLATHGPGSQGSHDCTGMSHCQTLCGAVSTPGNTPTHSSVSLSLPHFFQLETSLYSDPGQFFVCCLLCVDFSLCTDVFLKCWMRGQGWWRSHWEKRQGPRDFCI